MTRNLASVRNAFLAVLLGGAIVHPASAATADPDLVKKGEYLATAGDCISCHTGPSGIPLAGGRGMGLPFGTIYTPNITPDPTTGIGNWTDDQFVRAVHEGIDAHGQYLYPAFPFPWYTKVSREDALAIKAYLFSLAPVHMPRTPNRIAFPFNIREGMLAWRVAFFKPEYFKPDPKLSDELNRGAYLVQGLGHCGECHNANNLFGASSYAGRLEGEKIEGWYAPNITSDGREGIGKWSVDELATFLKTGAAPGVGVVLGPMKEVVDRSLSHLSDSDIHAIAVYLKSVPPKASYPEAPLAAGELQAMPGAAVYLNSCASCHQPDGSGVAGMIPKLAGNGAVLAGGPEDVIRAVVGGLPAGHGLAPMPAVGVAMTDQEIADVANYIRKAWGNAAPDEAGPGLVAQLRGKTQTMLAGNLPGGCPPLKDDKLTSAIEASGMSGAFAGMNEGNMLERIDAHLPKLVAATPGMKPDDLVNGLTQAYCPVALADTSVAANLRPIRLGNFSSLVYGQLRDEAAHISN